MLSEKEFSPKWTEDCQSSFAQLKEKLVNAPFLGYPNFKLSFRVEIDACLDGLGAVSSKEQEEQTVVIAYASRSLHPNEKNMNNYSSMKLEMLALKWVVTEQFRDYLLGGTFVVYTDNNPVSYTNTSAKLGATEMRWVSQLAQLNFEIKYRPGRTNINADPVHKKLQTSVNHITQSAPLFEFSQGSKM